MEATSEVAGGPPRRTANADDARNVTFFLLFFLHESSLEKQPEHEAAGVGPPEGASYRESPPPQSLQRFVPVVIALDAASTRTLWYRYRNK